MPNQHTPAKRAVTYRLPHALLAALHDTAAAQGLTDTAFVEAAIHAAINAAIADAHHAPTPTRP